MRRCRAQSGVIVAGRDIPDVEVVRDGTKETLYRGFRFAKQGFACRSQYADVQFPDGQKVLAGELIRPVVVGELVEPRASAAQPARGLPHTLNILVTPSAAAELSEEAAWIVDSQSGDEPT
jgi:hypothetical protein